MSVSLNKVTLLGNVGRDPEIRTTTGGDRVANFSMATSERWRDKSSGEKKEKTDWHRITVWGPLIAHVEKYVKKGSRILVHGKLTTRKYKDKDGQERTSTEVTLEGARGELVLLDIKADPVETPLPPSPPKGGSHPMMDDIPFAPEFR